jgi:NAD(P)-dependent dehydrogenase (short-subunit alcohol dehydrogenase family)
MESIEYFTKEESFKGKNVIITGSCGGIGALLTEALIMCGAKVMAVGRNEKKIIEKFGKYAKDKKYEFNYEIINLEDPPGITKGFKNIMIKLGGKVDIIIMSHGQFKVGKLMETGIDVFDSALNINVRSCFHLISLATPFLKISQGNIVAVSSVEAKIFAREGFANSVSKAMLNSLIECSALELSSFGIRVNAVAPSITATNHRVSEYFNDRSNKEYLEKMGGFFLLNKEVY